MSTKYVQNLRTKQKNKTRIIQYPGTYIFMTNIRQINQNKPKSN